MTKPASRAKKVKWTVLRNGQPTGKTFRDGYAANRAARAMSLRIKGSIFSAAPIEVPK